MIGSAARRVGLPMEGLAWFLCEIDEVAREREDEEKDQKKKRTKNEESGDGRA